TAGPISQISPHRKHHDDSGKPMTSGVASLTLDMRIEMSRGAVRGWSVTGPVHGSDSRERKEAHAQRTEPPTDPPELFARTGARPGLDLGGRRRIPLRPGGGP